MFSLAGDTPSAGWWALRGYSADSPLENTEETLPGMGVVPGVKDQVLN